MPTLKDIQEEMDKKFDEKFEEVILDQEVRMVVKGIKLFIESEISLAYQAGEKEGNRVTLDMVLKEIEGMEVTYENENDFYFNSPREKIINQALSSLKEKIISNNQK